jgi:hypothetical protein
MTNTGNKKIKDAYTTAYARTTGTCLHCMDCMFWYRCKRGGIDCELKVR